MESQVYNWDEGAWKLLKLIMNEPKYLVQHQIDSYNYFIEHGLKSVIEQFNSIILNYDFVENQQFYRLKPTSIYYNSDSTGWTEYHELTEIYTKYHETFIKKKPSARIIDLIDQ